MSSLDGAEEIEIQGSADDVIAYLASLDANVQIQTQNGYLDPALVALAAAGQIQIQTVTEYPDAAPEIQTGYVDANRQIQTQSLLGYQEQNLTGQVVGGAGFQPTQVELADGTQQVITQIVMDAGHQALQASGHVEHQRVETQILTETGYRPLQAPGQIQSQLPDASQKVVAQIVPEARYQTMDVTGQIQSQPGSQFPGGSQQGVTQIVTGTDYQPPDTSGQTELQAVPNGMQQVVTQLTAEAGYQAVDASGQTQSAAVPAFPDGTHNVVSQKTGRVALQQGSQYPVGTDQILSQIVTGPALLNTTGQIASQVASKLHPNSASLEAAGTQAVSGYEPVDPSGQPQAQTPSFPPGASVTSSGSPGQPQTQQTPQKAPGQIKAETAQVFSDSTRQIDPQIVSRYSDASKQMQTVAEHPEVLDQNEPQATSGYSEPAGQVDPQTTSGPPDTLQISQTDNPNEASKYKAEELVPQSVSGDQQPSSAPSDVSGQVRIESEGSSGEEPGAMVTADTEEQTSMDEDASDNSLEHFEDQEAAPADEEGPSRKFILLPRLTVKVTCGGCGKEAEIPQDHSSHTESSYVCEICKSRAQKKLRLHQLINGGTFVQEPQRSPDPKTKHPCPDCNKEFGSPKDLRRHSNIHMGLKPFKCDTCGKAFSQSCGLKRHLLTHTDEKPHRCEVCGLTFKGHLARHMRSHSGEMPFKCDICQKGFYKSELLKKHMSEHMSDGTVSGSKTKLDDIFQKTPAKEHTCLICDKTYTNGGHLTRHMKQHNNENVLRCGVCTKVFYVKQELQEHLQGHSKEDLAAIIAGSMSLFSVMPNCSPQSSIDEPMEEDQPASEDIPPETTTPPDVKPEGPVATLEEHACLQDRVTCGICGHACCCTNYIPVHMEGHEGAMVQCRSCGMDFIPMGTGEGSQICTVCSPQESGIDEKPIPEDITDQPEGDIGQAEPIEDDANGRHECIECGKTYKFVKDLHEHALTHGREFRPYKCKTCGKGFTKRYHLNRHELIHARGGKPRFGRTRSEEMRIRGKPLRLIEALPEPRRPIGRPRKYPLDRETKPKQDVNPELMEMNSQISQLVPQITTPSPQKGESKSVTPVKKYTYVRPPKNAGSLPFVCCACGKGFPKRVPLKRHLLNHLREGSIPKDHPQLEEMRVHSYVDASDSSPQLKHCPLCGKACKGLHLLRHMKIHTEEEIAKYYEEGGAPLPVEGDLVASPEGCKAVPLESGVVASPRGRKAGGVGSPERRLAVPLEGGIGTPERLMAVPLEGGKGTPERRVAVPLEGGLVAPMERLKEESPKVIYKEDENPIEGDDSDYGMGGDEDGMMLIKQEFEDETPAEEVRPHDCLDDKVTCGICGHSCCCANYITVHMEMHNNESDTCQKCGKELGDLPPTYHKGGRICSICTSRSRKQLRLHQILRSRVLPKEPTDDFGIGMSTSGGDVAAKVVEKKRMKTWDRRYSKEHIRIHAGEKRYQCEECGLEFNHSRNYKRHIWRHTGEKPNWCNICKKGIAGHLARHMRSHSDQKSYVCNMCQKGFNRSEHLKRHLKTHLGMQDTYQCHLCPKKYLRKEHLKRHIKSHSQGTESRPGGANQSSHIKPNDPPVNEQPYREHPCTSRNAVCGLCGDVCCCSNYIPFHMEVHGEKPEDYLEGSVAPDVPVLEDSKPPQEMPAQDVGVRPKEHSCTYDPVTCGLCGHACCCANYIPLHMKDQHGDSAKDHIPNTAEDATQSVEESPEAQHPEDLQEHACMRDSVTCGLCTEVCCCSAMVPQHMRRHIKMRAAASAEDDILKRALDATAISDDHIRPHPCLHEIVSCGVCGEPCCCVNYIRFHMEQHSESVKQETDVEKPMVHEESVANPDAGHDDQEAGDVQDSATEVVYKKEEIEDMETQDSEAVPEPSTAVEPDTSQGGLEQEAVLKQAGASMTGEGAVNNGGSEEFDWASVATFLQGAREEEPAPATSVQPNEPSMEESNGSPVKQKPNTSSMNPPQIPSREDHACLEAQVDCEICGITFCCINDLLPHLDTHNIQTVRCEVCLQSVNVTKTISVLKDGMKIYKCGTCVMGVSPTAMTPKAMSPRQMISSATSPQGMTPPSPAKPAQSS